MIANFGMYDWPGVQAATDLYWAAVRDRLRADGIEAPDALERARDHWSIWRDPALLLGHTCGMPFRTRLAGTVTLVGTPDYGVDGAPPGYYRSVLVVRRADRAADWRDYLGRPLAINDGLSQSGWAAPQNMAAAEGARFTRVRVTGAHRASAHAVARGTADIAAIDAVTWRLFTRFLPDEAATLAVLAETEPTPGLPYITARPGLAPRLASAIGAAIDDLAAHRNDLAGLRGLVPIPEAAYLAVPTPAPLTEAETLR